MLHEFFRRIAHRTAAAVGSPWAFSIAIVLLVAWAASGPFFNFSNTWQLVINTFTTISTFLTVFLIQNTQNRDSKAIHLKLDELIKVARQARNELIDIEDRTDEELKVFEDEFSKPSMDGVALGGGVVVAVKPEKKKKAQKLLEEFHKEREAEREDNKAKIITALEKKAKNKVKNYVTNDEVQALTGVSDATATRYMDTLEKEGKVEQIGEGRVVRYILKN
ncbi:MAG: low affinity iron permease family protein [Candidatus Harrisonbacteria bacterium CG10_big_fil_rev_8_21_14_0_10_49_15]|uniref:Low affinity iron permease family protein n=1 Tax=Candidatus Harrisonbacteria bacterium CG10_big_fil_rev_8_21_14_0_10_49_15 TaxID=1974587 RepID=A0A2H0UKI6_9BACT|nr:MAG: low affinity iron permease family protein [Candidatus Harrisonbacteria bacterium CG10_big_fil_rev_8_21_14_0_10_49_15]